MGKVKDVTAVKTSKKRVSIPYGKGKVKKTSKNAIIAVVSIPYGKGKVEYQEVQYDVSLRINSLWER